jgi:hypothetical protein
LVKLSKRRRERAGDRGIKNTTCRNPVWNVEHEKERELEIEV